MLCKRCGSNVLEGVKFCPNCGASMDNVVDNNVQGGFNQQPMYNQQPVQQPMYNQPPMQQPMYNQPVQPQNNNQASSGLIIGVIIAVIVAIGVIVFMFNDNGKNSNSNSNSNSNITSNSNSNIDSNSNSNVVSNSNSNITSNVTSNSNSNVVSNSNSNTPLNTVITDTVAGYVFEVPKGYKVNTKTAQYAQLLNTSDNSQVIIMPTTQKYDELRKYRNNKSYVDSYLKGTGISIQSYLVIKTYGGKEFLVCDVSYSGNIVVMTFSKMSDGNTMVLYFANPSYTKDYSKISLFANTVKTAKAA